ncbi:TPA: ABC transporter permease [Candidatus Poribacteria bacterium]|jgi:putative ABC transport system permease protein|nr:ABC transporter permease [Candidatus Poribacteria bacterium]HIC01982.1 ABC transporter permease [Candidatus Poribacteria bacterium]HIN30234.1 ABC transporter permease [Candidatus Poribacteria bacterium]HIO05863.1 ABC transporter permease [Candidatus Poribacteria bacterium]HIO46510.1 ABC transporter permease [Candidatus Poribacteria bacterium]
MGILAYIGLALSSLRRNPLRSALTILGIVAGVCAVVGVVSVGDGSRAMVLREIERTGGLNVIEIYKDAWDRQSGTLSNAASQVTRRRWQRNRAEPLETPDVEALLGTVANINLAVPEDDFGGVNLNYNGQSKPSRVVATASGYDILHNWYVESGRFLSDADDREARSVTVIGFNVKEELFGDTDPIGKEVKATRQSSWRRGTRFDVRMTVIGVMEEKGGSMDTEGWDDRFIIPITTLQQRFKGRKDIERIRVQVSDLNLVESVTEDAKFILGRQHNNTGEEYQYWTAKEELAQAEKMGTIMKLSMGAIAGIALLVAGIGVMNIMLVSVTERTKEIGLRKAVGAKRRDILIQFLIEAMVLTFSGGIMGASVGIFAGKGFAWVITKFVWPDSGWPAVISTQAIILALSVSIGVGLFFGLYPANKASKLQPIEALRSD